MPAVLGIDAAWTLKNPSGVALLKQISGDWHVVAAEPSYGHFDARANGTQEDGSKPRDWMPDAGALIGAASKLAGSKIDLVAIDMPLSHMPIKGRRHSDDAISAAYGGRWASTHSPSAERPGNISRSLKAGFEQEGYPLQVTAIHLPGLVEVYPHPALIELASASVRLPYKVGKWKKYWPDCPSEEKSMRLRCEWNKIVRLLEREVRGVESALSKIDDVNLKAYEDTLDAIICAWVGICALEQRAKPYGDHISAIWVPTPCF